MTLGDTSRAHRLLHDKSDIRQYWRFACFLSHAQMFKLMKHFFLNSIRIWSGSELWQRFFLFFKGERIQISQKAGHHRHASKTPLNGVSLPCWWWPNVECWLGSFWEFQGIRSSIAKKFYVFVIIQVGRGSGPSAPPPPPLDPRIRPEYVYTYWDILKTHFIVRIGFYTTLCVLSIDRQVEREMRFLF